MKAALVTQFGQVPQSAVVEAQIAGPGEIVIDVLAAGLHHRVRSQADGSHYTSTDQLPLTPGVDGVGRDRDGRLRYFVLDDTVHGSMAEQVAVHPRQSVVLPDGSDPVAIAAGMNPAMSSWIALRKRIDFTQGQSVLILGATGSAGRLAVQIAAKLGASRIIGSGRNAARLQGLAALGATATVLMDADDDATAARFGIAADVDIVLDYLWGAPTVLAMEAIVTQRTDAGCPLQWISIGSMAGATAAIPSAALRSSGLRIVGSGQGSVSTRDILSELPGLAEELSGGSLSIEARAVPLDDVEDAWNTPADSTERIVIVPTR